MQNQPKQALDSSQLTANLNKISQICKPPPATPLIPFSPPHLTCDSILELFEFLGVRNFFIDACGINVCAELAELRGTFFGYIQVCR